LFYFFNFIFPLFTSGIKCEGFYCQLTETYQCRWISRNKL